MLPAFDGKRRAVAIDKARAELYFYARWMMLQLRGIQWMRGPHHQRVCDKLMAVFRGEILRLIINMPPRFSKTQLVTDFITYGLGHYPDSEFMYLSYSGTLAGNKVADALRYVQHPAYQELFPEVLLTSSASTHWQTTRGGQVYAAGTEGTVIGFGAGKMRPGFGGALIIDDPHNLIDVFGPVREKVIKNVQTLIESRRNWSHTPVIVIAHCLHEEDLIGWLKNGGNGETWDVLSLPAMNDDGTALWPEKLSVTDLQRVQKSDPYMYMSQYMQSPTSVGGAFFNRQHLLVDGEPVETPEVLDGVFCIIDTANKAGETHDGTGVVFFGIRPPDVKESPLVILDWDITKIEGAFLEDWIPTVFQRLEELARETHALQGSIGAWIEDKGSGIVLLQQCRNKGLNVHAIDNKLVALGKAPRCININGYITSGKCKFSRYAYEKTVEYKRMVKNHLLVQILSFSAETGDQGADDLLDCWSYGVALGMGNAEGF